MMAAPGGMGLVRGPQGQLLRHVLQQPGAVQSQRATFRGVAVSGPLQAGNLHHGASFQSAAGDKGSAAAEKGSPTKVGKQQGAGHAGQHPSHGTENSAGTVMNAAAVQQAQQQAQAQGLFALPASAFGGLGAAQMVQGAGGLCLVPRHAFPAGAQAVAGMLAQGWMPQMNAAGVAGMHKPFVPSADYMQLQAAQAAGGFAMQWPQGRCV